jgi:hypothetical protein
MRGRWRADEGERLMILFDLRVITEVQHNITIYGYGRGWDGGLFSLVGFSI